MRDLLIIVLLFFSLNITTYGQQNTSESDLVGEEVQMADTMRSEGKIYVVVAIVTTILAGLIIYAVIIDRKVSKLEEKIKNENNQINI